MKKVSQTGIDPSPRNRGFKQQIMTDRNINQLTDVEKYYLYGYVKDRSHSDKSEDIEAHIENHPKIPKNMNLEESTISKISSFRATDGSQGFFKFDKTDDKFYFQKKVNYGANKFNLENSPNSKNLTSRFSRNTNRESGKK